MIRFCAILFALFLCSCMTYKTIYYTTDDIPKNQKAKINKTVCVLSFNDIRKDVAGNELYLTKPREIYEEGKTFCINSELHYKKFPMATQIAAMLADHLFTRKTFKNVELDKKDSADYIIQGNLARLTSKQLLPKVVRGAPAVGGAIGGAVGGAIGGVISSFVKSKAIISIALTEVKVYDRDMNLLLDLGSFAKDFEEEMDTDPGCWCAYENLKSKLKLFNTELVNEIENKIGDIK